MQMKRISVRFTFTLTYMLILLLFTSLPGYTQSEAALVYPGNNGKLVYKKHVNTNESNLDNIIIDFSNCGYMGGGVAIPDVPVKITLSPQGGDNRLHIQEAIDYVSGLQPDANGFRGAVLLKAGTYNLTVPGNDALQIKTSGVVLRGEGQGPDGTILKTSVEKKHQIIATRPVKPTFGQSNKTRITDAYVGSGLFGFRVQSAAGYAVGDKIFVRFTPNETWLDETYANSYMDSGSLLWDTQTYTINYERIITHINGDSITIHSPVILPMQTKYGGGEIVKLSFNSQRLHNVGVENMRLIGVGVTATCAADNPNRLNHAVYFEYTGNSWLKGITVEHTANSLINLWDSHYITVEECASLKPLGPKTGGYRYAFYINAASSHNLIQRTYSDDGRHDYVLGPRIPGPNVFLDGVSERGGTQGPHQRWATGTLFDNLKMQSLIALEHRGNSGSGHSWAGIQSVIWNTMSPSIVCDTPVGHMNYAIGNTGKEVLSQYINNTRAGVYRGHYNRHGSPVATRSLYLKQLEDRLGEEAVKNVTISQQRLGTIYDLLTKWKGNGNLLDYQENFTPEITFNVNMKDVTNLHNDGSVWLVTYPGNEKYEMIKDDNYSMYSITQRINAGTNLVYMFAYSDASGNIVTEQNIGSCSNSEGYRHLIVPVYDLILDSFIFGSCEIALPPGTDITDLEGTIISGSNDDEPWINGSTGAGSPPKERVEKLIDNDISTKYLVRAVSSWVEIKTNKYSRLSGYTITSANDMPSRDPRSWQLQGWDDETNQWVTLHNVKDNPEWDSRFKTKVWIFENNNWYYRYRLFITEINGNEQELMQMAEMQLFGVVGDVVNIKKAQSPEIRVFPNPARNHLNIEWNGQIISPEISLYDITGRKVYSTSVPSSSDSAIRLNTNSYKTGLYILQIKTGDHVISRKIIIE
jgi:hypothetical protein